MKNTVRTKPETAQNLAGHTSRRHNRNRIQEVSVGFAVGNPELGSRRFCGLRGGLGVIKYPVADRSKLK